MKDNELIAYRDDLKRTIAHLDRSLCTMDAGTLLWFRAKDKIKRLRWRLKEIDKDTNAQIFFNLGWSVDSLLSKADKLLDVDIKPKRGYK